MIRRDQAPSRFRSVAARAMWLLMTFPGSLRILGATAPVDFRESHDVLAALVLQVLGEDPLSGSQFVFANKRAKRLKVHSWEGDESRRQSYPCDWFAVMISKQRQGPAILIINLRP